MTARRTRQATSSINTGHEAAPTRTTTVTAELPITRAQGHAQYAQSARHALQRTPAPLHRAIAHRDGSLVPVLKPRGEDLLPARLAPDTWFRTRHAKRRPDTKPGTHGMLQLLAASALAGAAPHTRTPQWLRPALQDPANAPGAFALRELLACLNADDWERLVLDEALSWRQAAHVLRTLALHQGALVYVVNDHAYNRGAAAGKTEPHVSR